MDLEGPAGGQRRPNNQPLSIVHGIDVFTFVSPDQTEIRKKTIARLVVRYLNDNLALSH